MVPVSSFPFFFPLFIMVSCCCFPRAAQTPLSQDTDFSVSPTTKGIGQFFCAWVLFVQVKRRGFHGYIFSKPRPQSGLLFSVPRSKAVIVLYFQLNLCQNIARVKRACYHVSTITTFEQENRRVLSNVYYFYSVTLSRWLIPFQCQK